MGNHEAEFLADPTEKKVKDFAQDLRGAGLAPTEVAACRGDVGQFLCSLPFGARVDDWFFSHGGNTGGRTISQLAADFETGVGKDGFGSQQLVDANSMLEARLGEEGPGGKSWFEVERPQRNAEQLLSRYVAALGVDHLVQGHQHQTDSSSKTGNSATPARCSSGTDCSFLIDVGMSEGVGDSHGAILHIRHKNGEEASAIDADGTETEPLEAVGGSLAAFLSFDRRDAGTASRWAASCRRSEFPNSLARLAESGSSRPVPGRK